MRLKISYQISVGGGIIEHDLSVDPDSIIITPAAVPEVPGAAADQLAPPFHVNVSQRGDAEDLAWLVLPTSAFRLGLFDD